MEKHLLQYIDVTGLDPMKTVVRCATQDEANIFLDYLRSKGVWNSIEGLKEKWCENRDRTCYHLALARWCSDVWYERTCPQFRIVDFCDIYKYPVTEPGNVDYSYEELFA